MDFAEAIESVSGMENGEALKEAILSEVRKKGSSEATLRSKLKAYEGVDPEKYHGISEALQGAEIDLEGDIAEQIASLKGAAGKTTELDKVMRELNSLKKNYEAEQARASELEQKNRRERIYNSLVTEFDSKVLAGDLALERLLDKGMLELTTDGKPAYKRGDELVVDDIAGAYLQDYPKYARNTQKGGAGVPPNAGDAKKNVIRRSEFDGLSPEQKIQTVKDKVQVID